MNNIKTFVGATAAIAVIVIIGGFFFWQNISPDTQVEPVASQLDAVEQVAPAASQPDVVEEITDERLIEAVIAKDPAAVAQLLEAGISPNIVNADGDPIMKSIIYNQSDEGVDIIALLIEHGADVNAPDSDGNALLPMAARGGKLEVVQLLLDAGADVNGTMSDSPNVTEPAVDASALMEAAQEGHIEIVELLIAHGADVNYAEKGYERTALHYATWSNNSEIVSLLIKSGAELNPRSTWGVNGGTPLHFAARHSSVEAAEVLINAGANLDIQSSRGLTPLLVVLGSGEIDEQSEVIVTLLLEAGADANLQENSGNAALHDAVRFKRIYAIPLLIKHGAALDLQNNNGDTALDIAKDEQIIEMLREAGAGG